MNKPDTDQMHKLWSMIKDIGIAMMTSEDGDTLRSRPMAASQDSFSGTLWFFTRADSHKVDEVAHNNRVCVSYADADNQNYVSLSGIASLVRDKAAIEDHWSEAMRVWFPKGHTDPEMALLKVDISSAEYWDVPSSTMVHAYGYLKAVTTGRSPNPGENAKLDLTAGFNR